MRRKKGYIILIIAVLSLTVITGAAGFLIFKPELGAKNNVKAPEDKLLGYMALINDGGYGEMYDSLSELSRANITREDFIERNRNIYEGIGARGLTVEVTGVTKPDKDKMVTVEYNCTMQTLAGDISFLNKAHFVRSPSDKKDRELYLLWSSQLIFPTLMDGDKVRVATQPAERGGIYDRSGFMLAGKGVASSVGFVPNKMSAQKDGDIERAAELLGMTPESINDKLTASYVQDDMFVALKTIPAGQEELEAALLDIKGIKITDAPIRHYPLGEITAHLTGYIQNVSAEDLNKLEGKGYNPNSVIGRSGLESIYEDRLRGQDGYEITITNPEGEVKQSLAKKERKNGENINLTIDGWLQDILYERFKEDKSCSVAMNPATGEVLALVSTPSFDANDFVQGMSTQQWDALSNDEDQPMYNRFKATWAPGSCFKAIIGAIGLTTGVVDPGENYGDSGLSWQKDGSWGRYFITTMTDYPEAANLENALVYSDNIYFAKAALRIGGDLLAEQLIKIGFDEKIPFEIGLYSSSFSVTERFENEVQLADSGYGQAQVIMNPIHMAAIYSAFVNGGSMIKPYLVNEGNQPEFWKQNVFTQEAAGIVLDDLKEVMVRGTGRTAQVDGLTLAGKTGTAEVKLSKDDITGTELGWFSVLSIGGDRADQLLIITMVEDVKHREGSRYVTDVIRNVLEAYSANP